MSKGGEKKNGSPRKRGPVADTLTIPGNRTRGGSNPMKKAPRAPIKKIGRKRP